MKPILCGYCYGATQLKTVKSGSYVVTHGYTPNFSLVQTATFAAARNTRLKTMKTHDRLNRLGWPRPQFISNDPLRADLRAITRLPTS
ncbi:MAG: hypothetical protein EXS40_06760 [Opitutaceae bacterium]|nr:hypothetical protein [Opitutaceae bacterium]